MENRRTLRRLLEGGDCRSLGHAEDVLAIVKRDPRKIDALMKCLWDSDPCVAMQAADLMEKLSREQPSLLQRYKRELLGLAAETSQQELRWHLAVTIPRLRLTVAESTRFVEILRNYLEDRSSIVKTFAMQGLFDLIGQAPGTREPVTELIRSLTRTGTAAMRARGRHLLKQLEPR